MLYKTSAAMHESNGDLSFKFRKVVLVISKSRFAEFV